MIRTLLNSGQRFSSGRLTIYHDNNIPGLENSYAGAYLVSKVSGNAVWRNRIKRWLREDLRLWQKEQGRPINGAIAIRFKGLAQDSDHRSLRAELQKLFGEMKKADTNA